jgi:hypothetical protein
MVLPHPICDWITRLTGSFGRGRSPLYSPPQNTGWWRYRPWPIGTYGRPSSAVIRVIGTDAKWCCALHKMFMSDTI